ncbi:MAG: hypothetical protein FWG97_01200 [Deltaproteobacteria bacterium]|nr:hypothetical protein [Deltaproteobacteria bacterium]
MGGTVDDLIALLRAAGQGGVVDIATHNNDTAAHHGAITRVNTDLRRKLTSYETIYVRMDGNDANNGLTNSATGAVRTWVGVLNALTKMDPNRFYVFVQYGVGEWPGTIGINNTIGHNALVIKGMGKDQTIIGPISFSGPGVFSIEDLALKGSNLIAAYGGAWVDCRNIKCIGINKAIGVPSIHAWRHGGLLLRDGCEFEGESWVMLHAHQFGEIFAYNNSFQFTGTPTIDVFASADGSRGNSNISLGSTTYNGSFTGRKWEASSGGAFPGLTTEQLNSMIPGSIDGRSTGYVSLGGRIISERGTVKAALFLQDVTGVINTGRSFGITSVTRTSVGKYKVSLEPSIVWTNTAVTKRGPGTAYANIVSGGEQYELDVSVVNTAGTLEDGVFNLQVF